MGNRQLPPMWRDRVAWKGIIAIIAMLLTIVLGHLATPSDGSVNVYYAVSALVGGIVWWICFFGFFRDAFSIPAPAQPEA